MLRFILAEVIVFGVLIVATNLGSSSVAEAEARALGFSQSDIDIGKTYALERRLLFWMETSFQVGVWTWIVCSGFARRLADACLNFTGRWLAAVFLVGVFCFFV